MTKFKQTLEKILKKEKDFLDEDNKLDYIKIKDSADKIDEKLIKLLISNTKIKKKFFTKIKDVYVFDIKHFKFFLDENKINNSYTQYKNRIGLTDGKRFLKDTDDIVLNFPYKDCVLEGGQSTEEGTDTYFEYEEEKTKTVKGEKVKEPAGYKEKQAKRKEIFFNEVLAHDEIDRLLDEKTLVNWKRFTKDGEVEVKEIKRDAEINKKRGLPEDTITENMIIKGNNLLALHSLKKEFAGKVKLIYIDPPYNTETDDFKYNDNFSRSTWLAFMKNRLEIAKEFLSDDGVIFVQCDDNEQAYLKVLMDDKKLFGESNLNSVVSVKVSSESGVKVNANKPVRIKEYLLIYSKTKKFIYKKQFIPNPRFDANYSYFVKNRKEKPKNWKILNIKKAFKDIEKREPILEDLYKFQLKYKSQIFSVRDISDNLKKKFGDNPNQFIEIKKDDKTTILWKKGEVVFFENKVNIVDGTECATKYLSDIWNDISWDGIANEGGVTLKAGKKPEKLLQRIISLGTQENDIVLDFFSGSGTTGAVAHKTNRQYILIEQMDYIHDLPEARLKKVIAGEQGGISKAVNWQGGGEFIYFELAEWNEKAKEEILSKNSLDELIDFFDEMYEKYFLNYNLKIKKFKEKVINEDEFKKLSLDEHKKMFIAMLDNNQMYVNKTEMEDKKFGINKKDIDLTKKFYNKK